MSLFDALTGGFEDGTPYDAAAKETRRIKAVESNLARLFRIRKGSDEHRPLMGVRHSGDICAMLKSNRPELEQELRDMLKIYEPRIEKVKFNGWQYLPQTGGTICFFCAALVRTHTRIPFKATFQYVVGGNHVEIATPQSIKERDEPQNDSEDFFDD
jgi:predicted component of type VI protein secretion system